MDEVQHWISRFGIKPQELSNERLADTLHVLNHNDSISDERAFELIKHIMFLNDKLNVG